jgi:hypothetical protein
MREILQHLNRKSFVIFKCQSVHLTHSSLDKQMVLNLMLGIDIPKRFQSNEYMSLDSKVPIADVFRSGKIVWINTLPNWGVDYPLMKDHEVDLHGQTFIAIPIFQGDVVKAVLSLICEPKLFENDSLDDFFMAIAGLLSLQLTSL